MAALRLAYFALTPTESMGCLMMQETTRLHSEEEPPFFNYSYCLSMKSLRSRLFWAETAMSCSLSRGRRSCEGVIQFSLISTFYFIREEWWSRLDEQVA